MKKWQLLALGAFVTGLGAIGVMSRHTAKAAFVEAPNHHLRFQFDWPRGQKETYALTWRATSETSLVGAGLGVPGAGALKGDVDLEGDLVVESFGARDGGYLLRERVENLRRHGVRVMGTSAMPTDADAKSAFEGKSALVTMDAAGSVRGMYFAKGESTLFQHVMQSLVTHTTVSVAPNNEESWDAQETNDTGTATVHYEVQELGPPRIERHRTAYTRLAATPGRTVSESDGQLSGSSTVGLDPQAHRMTSLIDDENIALKSVTAPSSTDLTQRSQFALTLRDVSTFDASEDPPSLAQLDPHQPGELRVGSRADQQIMDQRVAGMTFTEMKNTLLAYASTGGIPNSKFLSRATGYLQAHPEACIDLAALFEDPAMAGRGRLQVLELLAGADSPEAQRAMRVALESPAAHSDKRAWEAMVQRFSMVQRPTADSVQFVEASYREARDVNDRTAAAYALGASAGKLAKMGGDRTVVHGAEQKLVAGLHSATTATERSNMLSALGNLGLHEDEPTIAAFAKDGSPQVRAAAAWSLRKIDDADARATLFGIAADADPSVAASAFEAIGHQTMSNEDWGSFAQVVKSGATPVQADSRLVALLSQSTGPNPAIADMLTTLATRNTSDGRTEAAIQHVLQRMQ